MAGLEPARGCPRGILSPLRLPIPPHRGRIALYSTAWTYALSTVPLSSSTQMDGGGFEPPKQIAADLQSVPLATRESIHVRQSALTM